MHTCTHALGMTIRCHCKCGLWIHAIVSATWKALGLIFDKVWLQNVGVGGVLGPGKWACWVDFLIDSGTILSGFGGRKSSKNLSKIDPKSDQKEDAILNATWKALGPIFDGFWLQNGRVGGSWGPKNQEKSILGGVLGGVGGILGLKSVQRSATLDLR